MRSLLAKAGFHAKNPNTVPSQQMSNHPSAFLCSQPLRPGILLTPLYFFRILSASLMLADVVIYNRGMKYAVLRRSVIGAGRRVLIADQKELLR